MAASRSAIATMLGDALVDNAGRRVAVAELAGKRAVGLYFSAHWCPPCRQFTPFFANAYKSSLRAKGLEVVFVSSDRDAASFRDYLREMPWLALPYDDRRRAASLADRFGIEGIPSLVVLDPRSGEVITGDGVQTVMRDPTGSRFPWGVVSDAATGKAAAASSGAAAPNAAVARQRSRLEGPLLARDGSHVEASSLNDKVLGLYFSASWCGPCRAFTPELAKFYNTVRAAGRPLELVFVSADLNEGAFRAYYAHMPWLAVPFADRARAAALQEQFGVQGYPTLVFLFPDGTVNAEGRRLVMSDPSGRTIQWPAAGAGGGAARGAALKRVRELVPSVASDLNSGPSVIVFAGNADDTRAVAALEAVAAEVEATQHKEGSGEHLNFFIGRTDPVVELVRAKLRAASQPLVLAKPRAGVKFVGAPRSLDEVDEDAVRALVRGYQTGAIDPRPL